MLHNDLCVYSAGNVLHLPHTLNATAMWQHTVASPTHTRTHTHMVDLCTAGSQVLSAAAAVAVAAAAAVWHIYNSRQPALSTIN